VTLAGQYSTVVHYGPDIVALKMLELVLHNFIATETVSSVYTLNSFVWTTYLLAHRCPLLQGPHHHTPDAPKIDICLAMHRNRACGASNEKDRVYGLYGIFQQLGITIPQPSYSKIRVKIYWETTVAICREEQRLDLLMLVSGLVSNLNVPSWVPAFDEVFRPGDLSGKACAVKDSKPLFKFAEGNSKLYAVGKLVDFVNKKSKHTPWQPKGDKYDLTTIQDGPHMNLEEGFQETVQAFQDWYKVLLDFGNITLYGDTFQGLLDAFHDVLTLGSDFPNFYFRKVDPEMEKDSMCWWISILKGENLKEEAMKFVRSDYPNINEKFYDNPELRHLTESEEWQRLYAAKT
jgi:hypothetical protein